MNAASASDVCVQWLKDALRSLKPENDSLYSKPTRESEVQRHFMDAICSGDPRTAAEICRRHDRDAAKAQTSVVHFILPAVHQIEREWLADARSYNEVLHAFWTLQQVLELRQNAGMLAQRDVSSENFGSILLATAPGNEHNLGVLVVSEQFRASGWSVRTLLDGSKEVLCQTLRETHIDFLGLSVGCDAAMSGLGNLLQDLRLLSRNPDMRIVLGGKVFDLPSSQYDWLGADFVAVAPQDALNYCASITQRRTH